MFPSWGEGEEEPCGEDEIDRRPKLSGVVPPEEGEWLEASNGSHAAGQSVVVTSG